MRNITIILLTLLSMSCQSQIKNKEAMKKVNQEKLLKYFKKIEIHAWKSAGNEVLSEIHLSRRVTYFTNNYTLRITNSYPSCSKELNENLGILQYSIKRDSTKISFWKGDTQILETGKYYSKMVADFMATVDTFTTQQGTYDVTMRLMKGSVLVFPDGLKIELTGFTPRRIIDGEATLFARLKISKYQGEEHANISVGKIVKKDKQNKFITTYSSNEWKDYNIELKNLFDGESIDIIVTKNRKPEIDNIKELGKDSIIQLALDINSIDITNFEFIAISANHKDVYVNFKNSTQYIPLNKKFTTDLRISILGRTTSYYTNANPDDFRLKDRVEYYNPNDKENKKVIQFVFDAINKNKDLGNTFSEDFEKANVIIKEKETYYDVSVVTGSVMSGKRSKYKVKKETGEVYDATHTYPSKMPLPLKEGEEEEEEMYDLTYFFKKQINAKSCVNTKVLKKTFIELKNNILKNSEPVIDNELDKTTATYISNKIRFIYVKDENSFLETITIFDTKLAITYSLFCYNRDKTNHEYSIGSKYSIYLESKVFNEQKYKGIVAHFCKNIINKDF